MTAPRDADLAVEAERQAYRQRIDAFLASRDAANQLTYESLRAGIRLHTIIDAAAAVAGFADEALSIVQDQYRPRVACREGCSYCCSKPGVLVSIPEFIRLLMHIRSTFDAGALAALRERAGRYVAALGGGSFDASTPASVPCPLLVQHRCSAYDVRPLVCRGYNSTSVDACRRAHDDASALVPIFSILKDCTDGASVGVSQRLEAEGLNAAMIDLGTALHISLEADEGFIDRIVDDRAVLALAENPTWASDLWARVQETARQCGLRL